jgi:hypothetical protein
VFVGVECLLSLSRGGVSGWGRLEMSIVVDRSVQKGSLHRAISNLLFCRSGELVLFDCFMANGIVYVE